MPLHPDLHHRLDRFAGDFADIVTRLASARSQHDTASRRDPVWRADLGRLLSASESLLTETARFLSAHPDAAPVQRSRVAPAAMSMQRRAVDMAPDSYSAKDRTVDIVWTLGAAVTRTGWDGPYIETLEVTPKAVRLDRLNAGAPFLNTHSDANLSDIIGAIVPGSARIEKGRGLATVKLSEDPAHAGIVANIRAGVIKNVSVGYAVHRIVEQPPIGDGPPVILVVDWEPLEISAVPIPADAGAQIA